MRDNPEEKGLGERGEMGTKLFFPTQNVRKPMKRSFPLSRKPNLQSGRGKGDNYRQGVNFDSQLWHNFSGGKGKWSPKRP